MQAAGAPNQWRLYILTPAAARSHPLMSMARMSSCGCFHVVVFMWLASCGWLHVVVLLFARGRARYQQCMAISNGGPSRRYLKESRRWRGNHPTTSCRVHSFEQANLIGQSFCRESISLNCPFGTTFVNPSRQFRVV